MGVLRLLCFLILGTVTVAKIIRFVSDSQEARDNQGLIVSKFTFQGTNAKARLKGNDTIGGLYFFTREKLLEKEPDCSKRLKKASFSVFPKRDDYKDRVFSLTWSPEPATYYALFVDSATCHKHYPTQNKVSMELILLNEGQSGGHLSTEEQGLKTSYILLLLMFGAACACFGPSIYNVICKGGAVVTTMQLFLATNGFQFVSLLLPLLHWLTYESNGEGLPSLLSITNLTGILCDLAMIVLITDVITGTALTSAKRVPTSKSEQVNKVVAALAVIHVVLHFYTAALDTIDPSYHSFWAMSEILLSLLWVVEASYFTAVLAGTYQEDRSPLRKDFYASFAWIVLSWSLAHPASHFLVTLFLADYSRLKSFTALVNFLRGCALAQLARVLTRKTAFWEVSELSGAFLPFSERGNGAAAAPNTAAAGSDDQNGFYGYGRSEKLIKRN